MARADLLLDLVRSGAKGEKMRFRKALEAMVAEERGKQHHILADRLASHLQQSEGSNSISSPTLRNGINGNLFHEINPTRRLDSLILPNIVYNSCLELIQEHNRTDILRAHNLEPRHRVLLVGPPGNGKTSLAEALATELALPLLVVRYESVIASFLGETAVRLSRLFDEVRTRRCLLFFDEFDVVGKERGDVHETGEIKRVVSSLLLQIDDLPSHVIVVTATNHPELLDTAVWRRFQLKLGLPNPSLAQIQEWFVRFEQRLEVSLSYSPNTLAKRLKRLNFSDLEQFSLDVQRQYILSLPEVNMRQLIKERLSQWEKRYTLKNDNKANNA
ncbi:MAG: ATP-binding protein [Candidatus Marinimicrobia bacterium]|nr:ATP-binding protein [Candidatus Neomarinimicrobiota bacterium]